MPVLHTRVQYAHNRGIGRCRSKALTELLDPLSLFGGGLFGEEACHVVRLPELGDVVQGLECLGKLIS